MANPFLDPAFEIRWSQLEPSSIEPDISQALETAQVRIDELAASGTHRRTFDNTLLALESATDELDRAWGLVGHLDSVCNSDALRVAYNAMLPKVSEFYARIPLNQDLWQVIKAYASTDEAAALNGARRRFLDETLADFRDQGADLPPESRKRLEALEAELAQVTQKFGENVLDATNAWDLHVDDASKLAGLPETARATALADAQAKELGTEDVPVWRFTLHFPSMAPVLQHLDDESIRRQVWEASSKVAHDSPYDNTDLIWKILKLRQEKAAILGKADFADLVLERRMAKAGAQADAFVTDLHDRILGVFENESQTLRQYKATKTAGAEPGLLKPWETAYWAEKQRKELYDFDEEELRPYFPIDRVIGGLFDLAQRVFNLRIEEREAVYSEVGSGGEVPAGAVEVWHPEVKYYDMFDADDGRKMGSFFADWHPREPKRGGAWMNFLRTGAPGPAGRLSPHLGLICGNMTPSAGGRPALLTHREVETIFHEFGHLIHHLCGEVEIRSLNGVDVAWDFVELPSQIMENWCWEREGLDLFARHYETGEPIPDELFQKMLRARNYLSATDNMRQLAFGKMDLELHRRFAGEEDGDLDAIVGSIQKTYTARTDPRAPNNARRFTHLFSSSVGYAAAYYSYKWSEVLDADAFTRFKNEGILNAEVGMDFRRKILSRGNSEDPAVLFEDFMGRGPRLESLLKRAGLNEKG